MPDPRIERTRVHVLTVARDMLAERTGEPLTFSRLAEVAKVSRRTLYTHWGTIERVIGEAIAMHTTEDDIDPTGLAPRELLASILGSVRSRLADPVSHVALSSLVGQSAMDSRAAETLQQLAMSRLSDFQRFFGDVDSETYSQVVGPLFFSAMILGEVPSDEFMNTIVDRGVELLELERV